MRARCGVMGLAIAGAALMSCSTSPSAYEPGSCATPMALVTPGETLRLVTSVAPLADIVSVMVSGTDTEVRALVPAGVDSHTFEPTPSSARALERADAVVLNGLGLEAPTLRLAESNLADDAVVCLLGDEVLGEDEYRFDFSYPESAGLPNPHLWTNPAMVARYVDTLETWLSAVDPEHADVYRSNASRFADQITELVAAIAVSVETIDPDDRSLLTYHDAYAYFAADYGLEVVGAVQPSSFSEPTPRDVARLIEQIDDAGVRVVFGSEVFPSPVLRQLADEAGVVYVDDLRDDVLPGEPDDPEHSWLGLMRFNTITMVEALGGDASALRRLDPVR